MAKHIPPAIQVTTLTATPKLSLNRAIRVRPAIGRLPTYLIQMFQKTSSRVSQHLKPLPVRFPEPHPLPGVMTAIAAMSRLLPRMACPQLTFTTQLTATMATSIQSLTPTATRSLINGPTGVFRRKRILFRIPSPAL